ncbi:hypothetical protein ACHAQJ_003199 [Trichoderma viride]
MSSRQSSTACVNCRSRRIKCNETRPRCAQCARAGLFCWGYRNEMEMKFVNMTEKTSQRVRARQDRKTGAGKQKDLRDSTDGSLWSSSSSSSPLPVTTAPRPRQHELPLPTFNFSIPTESVAQVFFFRHYSIVGSNRLYAVQGSSAMSTVKMLGILAVGMAGLAISEQDHGVMALARSKYGSTLHSINGAIRIREEATKESTVAAVVLMAMFEAISCIIKRMPVPAHIRELVQSSLTFKADADLLLAIRLFNIICKLADLHSSGNTDRVTQITKKVSMAMSIEEELLSWESDLPETWRYTLAENNNTLDETYGASHHVYACSWQAYIWNHYRICRYASHTVLLHYLDTLALPVTKAHPALMQACTSQQKSSQDIRSTMLRDVRASVPYILGLYDKTKGNSSLSPEHSGVFGLLGSIQALVGVAGADICGEDAGWLSELLKFIGSRLGIGQALVMERYLRAKC